VKTSFYTTPEIKELLQNMAEESDKSLSLVINELLAEVLIEKQ
jgi:predicted transcriptional regulator